VSERQARTTIALMRKVVAGVRALLRKEKADAELGEELRGYFEASVAEKLGRGMSEEQARRAVRSAPISASIRTMWST
jgi:hypothetical protein